MGSAGLVLLITGAGGAFGAVIQHTGIGASLAEGLGASPNSRLWALLITYATGMIFRISQGSGTVAAITTMTIMAGAHLPQTVNMHPVWIALAALEPHFKKRLDTGLGITTPAQYQAIFATRSAAEWQQWGQEVDVPIVAVK